MKTYMTATIAALMAAPVFADGHAATGDAEAGAQQFDRQCVACHVVQDDEGEVLAGRNARTGPNLHGIAGRQLAAIEGFRYSDALIELGENETIWTEDAFVAYVQDPTGWIRETLDDNRARGKMAYRVRSEEDALNIYAFLATFDPVEMEEDEGSDSSDEAETETESD